MTIPELLLSIATEIDMRVSRGPFGNNDQYILFKEIQVVASLRDKDPILRIKLCSCRCEGSMLILTGYSGKDSKKIDLNNPNSLKLLASINDNNFLVPCDDDTALKIILTELPKVELLDETS